MAVRIIDTFPRFQDYWSGVDHQSFESQLTAWSNKYMDSWPELLGKQIEAYAQQGEDWRQIAKETV